MSSSSVPSSEQKDRKSKSYRGCIPCKLGRRKCTEERPICSHCEKISAKCEYDTESLFRFHVFEYQDGQNKLTQSARRGPPKRKASESSPTTQRPGKVNKQRHELPKPTPPVRHPIKKQLSRPVESTQLDSDVVEINPSHMITVPPTPNFARPWTSFPICDPFYDFFDEEERILDPPPSTIPRAPSSSSLGVSLPFYISPSPVPDSGINQADMHYFNYFLSEMANVLPYVSIFPSTVSGLFSSSIHHPALRHCVLTLSALCADNQLNQGKQRALEHLSKSLKLLQRSLWQVQIDECVANAIFLLAYFNLLAGDKDSARKHLSGLSMVLDRIQQDHLVKNQGVLSPYAISPLTMLIWRMAIRVDFIIAIVTGERPIFPMTPPDKEEFHRQWILLMADKSKGPDATEWALAWFALDNTMHRACHIASDAHLLRKSPVKPPDVEQQIQDSLNILLADHRQWKDRPIVKRAAELERNTDDLLSTRVGLDITSPQTPFIPNIIDPGQSADSSSRLVLLSHNAKRSASQFCHYPRIHLTNEFYANLCNHFNAIEIMIDLIARPIWGPPGPQRLGCAVDICRTHAALGNKPDAMTSGKIWGIYLAGIAFAGYEVYPMESEFVAKSLEEMGCHCYTAPKMRGTLEKLWQMKGNYWDSVKALYKGTSESDGSEV